MRLFLAALIVSFLMFGCGDDSSNNKQNNANNANNQNNTNNTNNSNNSNNVNNTNNSNNSNNTNNQADCVPTNTNWESTIEPILAQNCSQCHGDTPDFGAPFTINDYDTLIAGEVGERIVDRIVERVGNITMPPQTAQENMTHNDRDTLVEWASCGLSHPDHAALLVANRDEHIAPADPPAGARVVDFTFDEFPVGENTQDLYYCKSFTAPNDVDEYMARVEMIVDESRVLHHLVFMTGAFDGPCPTAFGQFYYAWAPGGGPIQFPNGGGVRIQPGQQFTVQVHYNNGAAIPDLTDSSGVRMHLIPTVQNEYRMMETGSGLPSEVVPPGETVSSSDSCRITQDGEMFVGFPHMHEIGSEFHESITRASDGSSESIIDLTGWAFDAQLYYQYDIPVSENDRIDTECVFNNTTDSPVSGGLRTRDEMCFDFIYVTPPTVNCN